MGVDDGKLLVANERRELATAAEIKLAAHRHRIECRLAKLAGLGKAAWFDASEGDFVAAIRQVSGQQILDTLSAGKVLAVDHVEHSDESRRREELNAWRLRDLAIGFVCDNAGKGKRNHRRSVRHGGRDLGLRSDGLGEAKPQRKPMSRRSETRIELGNPFRREQCAPG